MSRSLQRLGLPTEEQLRDYQIWDAYFTPAFSHPGANGLDGLVRDMERSLPAVRKALMQRMVFFPHVGIGTTRDAALETRLRRQPKIVEKPLKMWPQLLGMIQVNANDVAASRDAINRWLRDGPMCGVYFPGGGPGARNCLDPSCRQLIDQVGRVGGLIMQHTWFKTGGKTGPGESTPAELARVALRFPELDFVCAHAGGEWQKGIRAVRGAANVAIETSGFDATAGFIEMAVRELGAKRIIFGSHLPSRSLGTELGKIVGADISEADRKLILGANLRRLLAVRSFLSPR